MMKATALALLILAPPIGAQAQAIWCDGRAPPAGAPLSEGRRVSLAPGTEAPACLNVPLTVYNRPFPVFCAAKPAAKPGAWCDSAKGGCGPLPVRLIRRDKGRLATEKDVRYCASFANHGPQPVTIWLARPETAKPEAGK